MVFGGGLPDAGVVEQLAQLRQLVQVLDGLLELDVAGVRFGLGSGYGVDSQGTVWLPAGAPPEAWSQFLSTAELSLCRRQQKLAQHLHEQETALARLLGIGLVQSHQELLLTPAYRQFLERAVAAAAGSRGGALPSASGAAVSLRVEPGWMASETAIDERGTVTVPVSISGEELQQALARLGPRAAAASQTLRQQEADMARLGGQTERKLRLRRLSRDPALSAVRFKTACYRMLAHAAELAPLLDGLVVRVSETNALAADRSCIDIAWDWRL